MTATAVIGIELKPTDRDFTNPARMRPVFDRDWWVDGWGEVLHVQINGQFWDIDIDDVVAALKAAEPPRTIIEVVDAVVGDR